MYGPGVSYYINSRSCLLMIQSMNESSVSRMAHLLLKSQRIRNLQKTIVWEGFIRRWSGRHIGHKSWFWLWLLFGFYKFLKIFFSFCHIFQILTAPLEMIWSPFFAKFYLFNLHDIVWSFCSWIELNINGSC